MKEILEKIFEGYGRNYITFKNKFYDYLSDKIKNEPNKINFLKKLLEEIKNYSCDDINHPDNKPCYVDDVKPIAINIVNSKIEELVEIKNKNISYNIDNSINKNTIENSENIHISNINTKEKQKLTPIKIVSYCVGIAVGVLTIITFFSKC